MNHDAYVLSRLGVNLECDESRLLEPERERWETREQVARIMSQGPVQRTHKVITSERNHAFAYGRNGEVTRNGARNPKRIYRIASDYERSL